MIEINNLTNFVFNQKFFTKVAQKVLKGERKKTKTLSVDLVDRKEMRKLNKTFRKKDKPTDVLSFAENPKFQIPNSRSGYLGEIVICPEMVKQNFNKYGVPAKTALIKVFIHGILHLCGYDHEKSKKNAQIMEKKEKYYLSNFQ